ncbi:MAG: DegT/DnrJ/EryC1/StrS family aminotransferase, partial [Magnetospirillum sp.]|nr:DegT/DnrJ/EryC1/StrS family aminotransferase [Magnetospirillum sp.]
MRPLLPKLAALVPLLGEIDANRVYSNLGPLATRFQARLEQHWGLSDGTVLALSNATSGLSVALMTATDGRRGGLCMMPAWTFVASGHAALASGLTPFLVDVEQETGSLTPALAEAALAQAPDGIAAIMPVCPFGAPIDWAGWEAFRARTGIPVVIDAAAAFDSVRPSALPAVVSLHATKVLGIGEGAVLVCTDTALVEESCRRANFGFLGERVSRMPAVNAKMSEYHAAIALAALTA